MSKKAEVTVTVELLRQVGTITNGKKRNFGIVSSEMEAAENI